MALLEREEHLATLGTAMGDAARGAGRLVVVTAEAGGGKTALVRSFAGSGAAARVLMGACDDLVTPLPFGPLLDIARTEDPALESALLAGRREEAFTRLLDLLERKPNPALVVVEDAQWIDQASAELLGAVARRIDRLPIVLVVTLRSEGLAAQDPGRTVSARAPVEAIRRIALDPLSVDAVSELVDRQAAERIVAVSGGNPFFVSQLVESGGEITPTITDMVVARARSLPDGAREVLDLISIFPARAESPLLDRVHPDWESAVEPAELAGLVDVTPTGVGFRHDLARRALEMSLAASRRRALHARVLAAGRELGLPSGRIVHHASGAGAGDVVVEVGPLAAAEASRLGSHREAAAHYRRVLVHPDLLEAGELAEIEECYSLECWAVNDAAEAEASARRALAHRREQGGPLEAIGRNLRRIGRTRWFVGDATAAEEMLAEAIDVMEGGGETVREELASTLAYRGLIAGIRHSMAAARPWIVRALEVAAEGDQRIRALVLNDVGTVRYLHEGDPGELAESIRLAGAEGLHIDVVRGHVNLASCALAHRRYDEVKRHVADAARYSEEHQVYAFDGLASAVIAQVLFETGEWEAAEQAASGVSRDESFARIPASTVLARLKVRRGDPDASDAIDAAVAAAEATGEAQRIAPAAGAAAELAWMQRRLHTFVPILRRAHQIALTSGVPRWIGETAIWLRAAGELDEIPAAVEDAPRYMMEGRWEEAAAAWDGIGAPYEAAVARSFAEDTEVALSGLAELDSLGATPMARVTRARLAKRGVEKIPRGPRPSTAANAAGLTARQMDVMRLVVEGFTNAEIADRLFLSARTVDHHVAAILLKLGVESRRQVGARAETLGLVD